MGRIGNKVKDELKKQGKSVAWLARETGIPATTLRSAFSKDNDNISIEALRRIASALKVPMASLTMFPEYAGSDDSAVEFEADYIFHLFSLCGYEFEPVQLKDGTAYIINKKIVLVDDEFHDLIKGAQKASVEYVKDALEKKEGNNG